MLTLEAQIYLKLAEEGGMTKEVFSGMMPSLNVENNLIMCKVISHANETIMRRGQYHKVVIELPYGEDFKDFILEGYQFTLNTGGKIIAHGKVISLY